MIDIALGMETSRHYREASQPGSGPGGVDGVDPAFRPPVFRIRTGWSPWPGDTAESLCATPSAKVLGKGGHRQAVSRKGESGDLAAAGQGGTR